MTKLQLTLTASLRVTTDVDSRGYLTVTDSSDPELIGSGAPHLSAMIEMLRPHVQPTETTITEIAW